MKDPIAAEVMEESSSDLDIKKSSDSKAIGPPSMNIGGLPTSLMKSVDVEVTQAAYFQCPLLQAVFIGDENMVIHLIESGADVNISDNEGKTALFYSVQQRSNESVVRALIDSGANVNITDKDGKTALFYAVKGWTTNERVVCTLIIAGCDVNTTDKDGKTALFYAVQQSNNESVVRALIDSGADVNIIDKDGKTALISVANMWYNNRVMHVLINAGADVNATDNEGKTALLYAVQQWKNESVVCALIDAGADVNATDKEEKTALFYAVQQWNNDSVVHALIDAGADVNRTDNKGKTVLFYAVQSNNDSVVRALLEKENVLASPRDIYGRTPLFYAMTKSQSITSYLLEKKVNIRIKDNVGMSFLSFFVDHCISNSSDYGDEQCNRLKHLISERMKLMVQKGVRNNTLYEAIISIIFCKCPLLFYSGINVPIFIFFLTLAKEYCMEEDESVIDDVVEMVRKTVDDTALCRSLVPKILDLLYVLEADPNSADMDGNTALHYTACLLFHGVSKEAIMELLTKLEEGGVTFDTKNHQSETPLLFCLTWNSNEQQLLQEGNQLSDIKTLVEVCRFLIKNGSNVEEMTKKGDSVLHLIMRLLQQILERHGDTRLKDAVEAGIELFTYFSSTKAGKRVINKKDENLNLPIHLWASLEPPHQTLRDDADGRSVFSGFMRNVLNKLLECGTQLDERNKDGQTPLHLCRTWTAVELLIDSGANPNVVDPSGHSPLLVAAQSKTLLETQKASLYQDAKLDPKAFWKSSLYKGLDPWVVDKDGNSVLSCLIESEAKDLANAMIDVAYIDGYLESNDISTSLLNALCKDTSPHLYWKSNLVETILKSAKLVNIKTSLHLGFCCRNIIEASKTLSDDEVQRTVHWNIAKQLLSSGADSANPDEKDQSCLDIAEEYPALKLLLTNHAIKDDTLRHLWVSVSERYMPILEKVVRQQESMHMYPFWYYKSHLGGGSFGLVFAGINENDGREVAIKRIEKLRMKRPEDKREIRTLAVLAHCEQVVQYLSFFEDEHFSYIVLELMEGNLDDYLDDPNTTMNNITLCTDLAKGLEYLHGLNILHRDLKPSNILFKKYPKLSLKIADFGLSHYVAGSTSTSAYASLAGTKCWMAPELLMCTDAKSNVYSKASDMFSCGLVLHYILSVKKHPFAPAECNDEGTMQVGNKTETNILNGKMEGWDHSLCPEAAHLIKAMLDGDKSKRLSADKVLDHPIFWSKKKKVALLIAVGNQTEFEYPRAGKSIVMSAIETDLEARFGTIVRYAHWNNPGYVCVVDIYKDMKRKIRYDTRSAVELVRFIRNAYAHVSESARSTPIKKPLLEDFVFLEYFPKLVIEVYEAVTTQGWDQTREEIKYVIKN